jgi:hypothetical protein
MPMVLDRLNVRLLSDGATMDPLFGTPVEKVGRTTEHTEGQVREIDVTTQISYGTGTATFVGQYAATNMSDGGDSGSVIMRGGAGTFQSGCGVCSTATAVEDSLGIPTTQDDKAAKDFRDRLLRPTAGGSFLVNVFYLNEGLIQNRVQSADLAETDKAYFRALYARYIADMKLAVSDPDRNDLRVTDQHLIDARAALGVVRPFVTPEEADALGALVQVIDSARGKTFHEAAGMLDEKRVVKDLKKAFKKAKTLRLPEGTDD